MATKNPVVDQQLIRDLAGILNETNLSEIEVEQGDLRVRVSRQNAPVHAVAHAPAPQYQERPSGASQVAPAATTSAVVIVPSGSNSDARLSHAAGDPPAAVSSDAAGVTALLQAAPAASNTARLNVMVVERR